MLDSRASALVLVVLSLPPVLAGARKELLSLVPPVLSLLDSISCGALFCLLWLPGS